MGYALGALGMSYDTFRSLTPDEYLASVKAHERETREAWERMRIMAAITIQPHVKGRMTPKKLLPFPWDNGRDEREKIDKAEAQKRFKELIKQQHNG